MPEENNTQANETPLKTEIVAAIPVQEPTRLPTESSKPLDQTPPSASQKISDQSKTQLKTTNNPKVLTPENHRLVWIITIACLIAVGLSIAAVLAFKSSI